jgi:hypothetical protein
LSDFYEGECYIAQVLKCEKRENLQVTSVHAAQHIGKLAAIELTTFEFISDNNNVKNYIISSIM